MRHLYIPLVPSLAALTVVGFASAEDLALKAMTVRNPQSMLSPGDLERRGLNDGMTWTHTILEFPKSNANGPVELNVGSAKAQLAFKSSAFGLIQEGQKTPQAMTVKGRAVGAATIMLEGGRKYILAFPWFDQYRDGRKHVAMRSGQQMQGTLGSEKINFYDTNLDGVYSNKDDALMIGDCLVFAPITRQLATTNGLYEIGELAADGSKVSITPSTAPTIKLTVDPSKGSVLHAAFADIQNNTVFTVSGRKTTVQVPAGSYQLLYGLAFDSKGAVATIGKGPAKKFDADGTLNIGGPYKIDFRPIVSEGKLAISPSSIRVLGAEGEEYLGFNHTSNPTVGVSDGTKNINLGKFEYG